MSGKTVRDAIADWIHFEASIQNGFENSRGRSVNDHADDILSAILSAGFAVVPVEPTEDMMRSIGYHQCVADYGTELSPEQERMNEFFKKSARERYGALLRAAQEDKG